MFGTISQFDPFLEQHIKRYANQESGRASYLSKTTCKEFISLIGYNVVNYIITKMQILFYFTAFYFRYITR